MGADLGTGPRDGLMLGIANRTGWTIRQVRGGMELTVLAVGWLLGAAVGLGTIIHALLIGSCLEGSMRLLAERRFGGTLG